MSNNENTVQSEKIQAPKRGPMGGRGPGGGHGMIGEKPKDFKKTVGKLLKYMNSYLPVIIIALVLAVAGTVFSIIGPNQLGRITDEIGRCFSEYNAVFEANLKAAGITLEIFKQNPMTYVHLVPASFPAINMGLVLDICFLLVVLYSLGAAFSYVQGYIMATVTQRVSKRMRTELSEKINRMPLKYFDSTNHGNIMSRITNDVDTIGQTLSNSVTTLVTSVIMLVGTGIMMFWINWIMALAAIAATIIGFSIMMVIIKHSQKYFIAQQRELGRINGHIEEIYAGHNVVKAYNGEKNARKEFDNINGALRLSARKSQFYSGLMMPLMGFVGNLGFVAVCIVGAVLLKNDLVTLGAITSFMIYIRLFTNPLSQLAQTATSMQSAAAAGERVFEFLEEKELEDESHKTARLDFVRGDVRFENVKFGYNEDRTIINNFSASAKEGQKIAIVGPTGAGKTTMVNLLMRFYEVNEGKIYIDGIATDELTRENVRDKFCMVLQDTWLFEGTIRENLVFNKTDITDEQMIGACKAVGVDHYIRTLPKGYDTVLSDNANLSAGQKQLMTIARAMLQNAPMLILDEATSNVDTRTEILIQQAMDKLMAGRTSFVIAHRLSTIKNADLILVMKDGDIIEQGSHKALLEQNGFYAALYNSQFE